ncbi:hypothetical protein HO173_012206 [Letharia columbiana]|uniref:Uncharacterized protein n=1 Tax=Letharia columbiana TaxID=112416 RepID=A0A8H6CQ53_9LECA|nr:uncharacterized protein HO173_012206 [Letharia columbiana]KAF6227567.1 hypothetical protein HO173_012206 [Letharia columbiana]
MKTIVEFALLAALLSPFVNAQASEEQCAAQICCKNGNQDLSASCWSQCSSYQQQLAEIGCHILPPTPTSSSAPQVAPTLTTSWGPGQFCQGYGPGEGGDSCITIPAGCYVVPSGYNVVPQLYCTATATPSSIVASSTLSIMQITSSSVVSSPIVPSSSAVPPSSTPSAQVLPSSSATTMASSSASSALSSAGAPPTTTPFSALSSASVPPILTATSSVTPSSSIASSSAVQSSALPGIVGGVVTGAASASSAAQAFSQNPTTDTENALKQAVSAAQDAATTAKALADAAAFTALSAELATVLSSLSEAAATLASAEALADIAAAVAPELAAAEAAAATAQAIENAGPDSPEPTAQQQSANQPSGTQASPTISASSAAGSSIAPSSAPVASSSSAVTASSVMSASASSTITSSATASASTCDACVACADSTIAPIPTPGPVDPFAQYAGSITDNSTTTKPRKRFHSADFVEIEARANSATRDVTICGQDFSAPSYNSYSTTGNGNSYSPYYSYMFQLPRCSTYNWALTQGPTAPDSASYATEHIYELQLIAIFLRWLAANNAGLQAYLAVNNRNICANFINQILFGQGQQWTVTTFGAGGSIKTAGSRPIDELMSQMSGGTRTSELVYLETHLNGLKAQLFGGNTPSTMTMAAAQLALVGESSALYLYLQDPNVSAIFKAVSDRVKTFYAKLDRACGRGARGPCAANVQWQSSYQTWQAQYLQQIDASWQGWKSAQVAAAVTQITPKTRGSAMWQALLNAVNAQTSAGLLSAGSYTFAGSLTI